MSTTTGIEWTDRTWNPVTGCARVSPGCDNCYAAREASGRLSGHPAYRGLAVGGEFTGEVRLLPDRLDDPLRWRAPSKVFVNSMSDLFHRDIPASFVARVWATMQLASQHTFQVLTKRPDRMAALLSDRAAYEHDLAWLEDHLDAIHVGGGGGESVFSSGVHTWLEDLGHRELAYTDLPLRNVWLGTSIETDRYTFRARQLVETPAAVRFLSLEPLLGPLPSLELDGIDWVIVGGESGPRARPMFPEWVRDIRDRCTAAGVPFLFKQWGEWIPYEPDPQPPFWVSQHGDLIDGHYLPPHLSDGDRVDGWWWPAMNSDAIFRRVGKTPAGRLLDGRLWDEAPATPTLGGT